MARGTELLAMTDLILQAIVLGLLAGGIYALLASGLALIFGVMDVIHIAHGAFVVLGAYLAYLAYTRLHIDPLLATLVTVPLFFALGIAVYHFTYGRLSVDKPMMGLLVATGFALTIEGLLAFLFGGSIRFIDLPYVGGSFELLSVSLAQSKVVAGSLALLSTAALYIFLRYSRYGMALRASVQNSAAAELIGINYKSVEGFGFAIGLATTAIGGAALAITTPFSPVAHWGLVVRALTIIVLAGPGRIAGAGVAALALGVVESVTLVLVSPVWATLVFYVILALTLIFRPHGIFGGRLAQRF